MIALNASVGPHTRKKKKSLANVAWNQRYLLLFVLPLIVSIIIFSYLPMGGLIIAFKDYKLSKGFLGSEWVGFKYFKQFFDSPIFFNILRNTVVISLLNTFIGFPAPIVFALFLNEIRSKRYLKTIQTISYLPHFLSWVVVMALFTKILSPHGGIINILLGQLGISEIAFFRKPEWMWPIAVTTQLWKGIGWGAIIYMAVLAGIDQEQYEAAHIDGAKRLQRIWYISLPGLKSTAIVLFILNIGSILTSNFDQLYLMCNDNTLSTAEVIDTYVYRRAMFNLEYSFATAVGVFKSVISLLIMIMVNKLFRVIAHESLF
jgi:putative aldouronate transport system permease protein